MTKCLQIVVPAIMAIIAFNFMEPRHWAEIRTEALLTLSILSGAVLFRLGRGMPTVPADDLTVAEVKKLAVAFEVVVRRLVWIIVITGAAIIGLAIVGFGQEISESRISYQLGNAVLMFLIVFAICRGVILVLGDPDLAVLQSDLLVQSAQRHSARAEEGKLTAAENDQPFKSPRNYGKLIEPD